MKQHGTFSVNLAFSKYFDFSVEGQPPISFLLPKHSMFLNANICNMLKNYLKFRLVMLISCIPIEHRHFSLWEYKISIII